MLRKLLKYDLRANMKIFLFIWPAIVLFALLERLAIQADLTPPLSGIFINLTTTLYILAVIAACVFALVISVIRFYSGLLRNEGYLMFTLPVKPWQLVLSKLLTALLTTIVTILLSILSTILLFTGVDGFFEGLRSALQEMNVLFNTGSYILFALLILAQFSVGILQIYLACSIGHLFRRRRILYAVLFYYAINVAVEVAAVTAMILLSNNQSFAHFIYTIDTGMSPKGGIALFLGVLLAIEAALGLLFYFITERILRKHLNLE